MKWLMDLRWTLSKSLWKVGRRTFLSFVLLGCFITCFILLKLYKILPVGYRRYYIRAFADRPVYDTCVERHVVLSKLPLPLTALASFPGSGNSWARHLIQQLTGNRILYWTYFPFSWNQTLAVGTNTLQQRKKDVSSCKRCSNHVQCFCMFYEILS